MNTKEEIIGRLYTVIKALDSISVCGKQNLANLVGSIGTLEDIIQALGRLDANMNGDD